MKLIQKSFLRPTFEFTIEAHALRVKRSTPTASASFDIAYVDIDTRPSQRASFGAGWYAIGAVLVLTAFALLGGALISVTSDNLVGLLFGAFLSAVTGLRCLAEGRRETFSELVFHSVRTGDELIRLQEKLPSAVHVREFVEILKETIAVQADEWKRHEDWRG